MDFANLRGAVLGLLAILLFAPHVRGQTNRTPPTQQAPQRMILAPNLQTGGVTTAQPALEAGPSLNAEHFLLPADPTEEPPHQSPFIDIPREIVEVPDNGINTGSFATSVYELVPKSSFVVLACMDFQSCTLARIAPPEAPGPFS